jgi:hypothetical protein
VENIIALLTLTALEIVLGIDNIIFIAILAAKLPKREQAEARRLGIGLAVITRILLLLGISSPAVTSSSSPAACSLLAKVPARFTRNWKRKKNTPKLAP